MNLIVNARDAIIEGGKISLTTKKIEKLERKILSQNIHLSDGPHVLISMIDTGIGISEANIKKIFEPFFTTKPIGVGTGLGLSVIYGIIQKGKGALVVESKEGKGTIFNIYLPLVDEEKIIDSKNFKPEVSNLEGSETILFAEDEPLLRGIISETLIKNGYKVLEAENGKEAYQILMENIDKVQLIITDASMPEMSGPELIRLATDLKLKCKYLYLSGYSQDEKMQEDVNAKKVHYLEKPFKMKDLLIKLREILN